MEANKAVIKFGAVDGFQKAISEPIVTGIVRVPFVASESTPAPLDQDHTDSSCWTAGLMFYTHTVTFSLRVQKLLKLLLLSRKRMEINRVYHGKQDCPCSSYLLGWKQFFRNHHVIDVTDMSMFSYQSLFRIQQLDAIWWQTVNFVSMERLTNQGWSSVVINTIQWNLQTKFLCSMFIFLCVIYISRYWIWCQLWGFNSLPAEFEWCILEWICCTVGVTYWWMQICPIRLTAA